MLVQLLQKFEQKIEPIFILKAVRKVVVLRRHIYRLVFRYF